MEDSQSIRSEPNTKLHRIYQHSKSLLYFSPLLVCPVDWRRAGGTLACMLLLVREEWRLENLEAELTSGTGAELASPASWHLVIWQFY